MEGENKTKQKRKEKKENTETAGKMAAQRQCLLRKSLQRIKRIFLNIDNIPTTKAKKPFKFN